MVQLLDRPKRIDKNPKPCVYSASMLQRYREAEAEEETMESKIRKLEAQLNGFIQGMLKSQLLPKESEEIEDLSRESLNNIATIKRLSEQLQDADTEK